MVSSEPAGGGEKLLRLEEDVAAFLHEQADALFGGDVTQALDHHLRQRMLWWRLWQARGVQPQVEQEEGLWAPLEANLPSERARAARKRSQG
jgi:hypothetical protein